MKFIEGLLLGEAAWWENLTYYGCHPPLHIQRWDQELGNFCKVQIVRILGITVHMASVPALLCSTAIDSM